MIALKNWWMLGLDQPWLNWCLRSRNDSWYNLQSGSHVRILEAVMLTVNLYWLYIRSYFVYVTHTHAHTRTHAHTHTHTHTHAHTHIYLYTWVIYGPSHGLKIAIYKIECPKSIYDCWVYVRVTGHHCVNTFWSFVCLSSARVEFTALNTISSKTRRSTSETNLTLCGIVTLCSNNDRGQRWLSLPVA